MRDILTSVTVFLHCDTDYLFVLRSPNKTVDANRLNGIGGKVDPGEDYLAAAVRETEEETGYRVSPEDMRFCGLVRLEGGYPQDWIMAFFEATVPTKTIPIGLECPEGTLLWIPQNEVLTSGYELVDDLRICFPKIAASTHLFFMNTQINQKEKIESYTLTEQRKS